MVVQIKKTGNFIFKVSGLLKAGDERIELPPKVLETPIIPLDQSPVSSVRCIALDIYTI